MRVHQVITVLGLLSLWQPGNASGQEQQRLEGYYTETGMYRLEGRAAPKSVAVNAFFDRMLRQHGRDSYDKLLREELGLDPGSQAAQRATRAMFLAQALRAVRVDLTPYKDDPETFWKVQMADLREQTRGTMTIYRDMLSEVGKAGGDPQKVEKYVEEKVWPGVLIMTTGGPDAESVRIMREFDEP